MIKHVILFISLCFYAMVHSQENQNIEEQDRNISKHNELKLNIFNLVTFKTFDASYEYILDSESSVGISTLINLRSKSSNEDVYYREKFALTPYYRRYFSKSKYGFGFFVEGFMMYNVQADYNYYFEDSGFSDETSNNAALGFAVGGKFLTKKGIAFDLYGGLGRNFIQSNESISSDIVPRLGVSLGYRF